MARVGIVFGLILCGITFAGLVATSAKIPTQFYSMMLGIPILFCGVVSLNPHRRRLSMMVAAGISAIGALVGALWVIYRLFAVSGEATSIERFSLRLIAIMTVVCLLFVIFSMVGFAKMNRRLLRQSRGSVGSVRLSESEHDSNDDSDVVHTSETA